MYFPDAPLIPSVPITAAAEQGSIEQLPPPADPGSRRAPNTGRPLVPIGKSPTP